MDEGVANEHDYNDDRDLEEVAKSHQQLNYNDTVPGHNGAGTNGGEPSFSLQDVVVLPTLCAEAASAVVCSHCHTVTQPSSMFRLRGCTVSAALPLAVRTTHRPHAPLSPAAVNCRIRHKCKENNDAHRFY